MQLPEHAPALHTYWQGSPVVGHLPVASQVRSVLSLQVLSVAGRQTAPHCPGVMVPFVQAPWLLQVWGMVPEQLVAPGAQTPVQTPLTHAWLVQATGAPHVPEELHVCTPLPEHILLPAVQTPSHLPDTHVAEPQETAVPHAPLVSQVCTPPGEHCAVPGSHTPVQAPPTQA